ncbi:MAG: ATP-binding protein, partial [Gemmatimonadales bacterium]
MTTAEVPRRAAGDAAPGTVRILLLDDDEFDRRAVRRALLQSGVAATVDETASAPELLQRLDPAAHDCVLLDYYLPGVDTLKLLREVRHVARDLPVVMFTGRGDEEVAVELMKAGAADYLPKAALTPERLAASIRHALEIARAAAARRQAEQDLRTQEAHFRTLANAIPQLAWIAESDGRRSWYNERWSEFTGLTLDELQGEGWQRVPHPDHLARVRDGQRAAFERGEVWEDTYPLRRRDGVYRWFLSRAVPIRDAHGRILRWLGTNTDITQWKDAAVERERLLALEHDSRMRAERATALRDEVLGAVAHDLRNPASAIALATTNLLSGALSAAARVKQLGVIQRAAKWMDRLIADLLDVSQIEAQTLAVRRETVQIPALLGETLESFALQAKPLRLRLTVEQCDDIPLVRGDRDRLAQVLANLVGNALTFTPAGGHIRIRAQAVSDMGQISVEDSGIGIPSDELGHIFNRFWRADRAPRSGAGLGLTIARGIVEAHGGRIWAESTVGRGTT